MPGSMRGNPHPPAATWIVSCVMGFALLGATACGPPIETPPNLLLVTIDSTRADFLSCYGGDSSVGTRICALGTGGTRYTWAFSPSPLSAPSIASMLTSTYPSAHGVGRSAATFLRGEDVTLPALLRQAGYATAAFIGSPELNRSRNLQQGFDLYDDWAGIVDPRRAPERRAEDLTDATLAWLEDAPEPWFVWAHYRDPHGPYDAPVDTASARVPMDQTERETQRPRTLPRGERLPVLRTPTGRGGIPSYQYLPGLFTREAYELRYEAEIRYLDEQVGRLLSKIEEGDRPVGIALTADHGEAFGEDRYYFTHGHSVALDQIRVPLFWRPPRSGTPGAAPPTEPIDIAVSTLDLAPTFVRAAGLETPDAFHGRPLPTASDAVGAPQLARAIVAETEDRVAVIVGHNYYARDRDPRDPFIRGKLSSGALSRAHARTARLSETAHSQSTGPPLPGYLPARPAGTAEVLEPRLEAFLSGGQLETFIEGR